MKTVLVSPQELLDLYSDILSRTRRDLKKCENQQDFDTIHDVRARIRRLILASSLLPKSIRNERRSKEFLSKIKSFYKLDTRAVDNGIVRRELSQLLEAEESKHLLNEALQRSMVANVEISRNAKKVTAWKPPKACPKDFSKKQLRTRWTKVAGRLNRRVDDKFPIVLSDSKRVEELHRLRKDVRFLRYLLMFAERNDKTSGLENDLIGIQRTLGTIRDCDIAIGFVKTSHLAGPLRDALRKETEKRGRLYGRFVSEYSPMVRERIPLLPTG